MSDDELKNHIEKVLADARKAIDQANQALQKTNNYFIEKNICPKI